MLDHNEDNFIAVEKSDVKSSEKTPSILLNEKEHETLLHYLLARLDSDKKNRTRRVRRYASIDQAISTWQELSPEDSSRVQKEENTGKSQGVPLNMPIIKSNLDDTTSFFAEIFAPIGGNYYADPGKRDKSEPMKLLTRKMNEDSKHNEYYAEVSQAMASLFKYNVTGFSVEWQDNAEVDRSAGNRVRAIDLYNLMYDPAVQDVHKLHLDGEWVAIASLKTRLWLLQQNEKRDLANLDKVLIPAEGANSAVYGTANYYRYPPAQTRISDDGSDGKTSFGDGGEMTESDWEAMGLGSSNGEIKIPGYEVVKMYCWLSRKQFKLGVDVEKLEAISDLGLFCFEIVNSKWIISMQEVEPASNELPIYLSRMTRDELREADRSSAEHIRPFQRFISFLLNTHIAGVRSNIWGFTIYDPNGINGKDVKPGDVAGWIPSKISGVDLGTLVRRISNPVDTSANMRDAAAMMELIKQFYPNQSMPSQIASIDRAVSNQVSAVLQGSVRKLHMFCRIIDASLMRNVRVAQFKNIITFDADKAKFTGLTSEEISSLLNSGLGQLTREAAAEQIRTLIFTLLQNPASAQGIDMPGLWTIYSGLLNIGVDLGEFAMQAPPVAPPSETVNTSPMTTGVSG